MAEQEPLTQVIESTQDDKLNVLTSDVKSTQIPGLNFDDDILDEIGLGKFQYRVFLVLLILSLTEAAQLQIYTLTFPVIQKEFGFSQEHQDIMSAIVILGSVLGNFFSGEIANLIGRANSCIFGSLLLFFAQSMISISYDFQSLSMLRFITSFLIGFFGPIAITLLTEIIPCYIRGRFVVFLGLGFIAGQSFGVALSWAFLSKDLQTGDWRLLNLVSGLPIIIAFFFALLYLYESPRYLFQIGKVQEAFQILDLMFEANGKVNFLKLDQEKHQAVTQWARKQKQKSQKSFLKYLMEPGTLILTLLVWNSWISCTFIYYGIILFIPDILKKIQNINNVEFSVQQLLVIQGYEFLGQFASFFIIDKQVLGRKNSMILFFFLGSVFSILSFYLTKHFVVMATILKSIEINIQIFIFQFTSEIYPTRIRTQGVGVASAVSKFATIFMPLICGFLERQHVGLSFLLFACMNLLASFLSYCLPYDTTNRPLDQIDDHSFMTKKLTF